MSISSSSDSIRSSGYLSLKDSYSENSVRIILSDSSEHVEDENEKSEIEKFVEWGDPVFIGVNPWPKSLIMRAANPLLQAVRWIPVLIVRGLVFPAAGQNEEERRLKESVRNRLLEEPNFERLKLSTFDNAHLDTVMTFANEEEKSKFYADDVDDQRNQRWVVQVRGNNERYEEYIEKSVELSKHLEANVLSFNYRGVGRSTGKPKTIDDLAVDADTCVQYLLEMGVPSENIIIRGHSLGGGIAAKVANERQISLVNTNSYSSVASATKGIVAIPIIRSIAAFFVRMTNWNINSAKAWHGINRPKIIVYHRDDKMIIKPASLYKAVKRKAIENEQVKKQEEHPDYQEISNKYGFLHIKIGSWQIKVDENTYLQFASIEDFGEKIRQTELLLDKIGRVQQHLQIDLEIGLPIIEEEENNLPRVKDVLIAQIESLHAHPLYENEVKTLQNLVKQIEKVLFVQENLELDVKNRLGEIVDFTQKQRHFNAFDVDLDCHRNRIEDEDNENSPFENCTAIKEVLLEQITYLREELQNPEISNKNRKYTLNLIKVLKAKRKEIDNIALELTEKYGYQQVGGHNHDMHFDEELFVKTSFVMKTMFAVAEREKRAKEDGEGEL